MAFEKTDLRSDRFLHAFRNIVTRAENELDPEKVTSVLVKSDLSERLETVESQLLLGRRGTGKTHLIRAFEHRHQLSGDVVYYIDCRKLASGYSGEDALISAKKYFATLLDLIVNYLFDHAVRLENPAPGVQERVEKSLYALLPYTEARDKSGESTFNYKQIVKTLSSILDDLEIKRFYLLLDEWSSISPLLAQPHVAEFIKRCLLTVPQISIKLLAVNYQTLLRTNYKGAIVGLERGADITATIDIDAYLVFDEKADLVKEFFAQVLYNHLGDELGWRIDADKASKIQQVLTLFTMDRALIELVRAAEGNCRDLLHIFSKAASAFRMSSKANKIGITHIRDAAAQYYQSDKEVNLRADAEAMSTMEFLVTTLLRKKYKARTFMVESSHDDHPRLVKLLSDRVVHKLTRTYSHPDKPGSRYSLFTLDYGAYAYVKTNEPKNLSLLPENDDGDLSPEEELEYAIPEDDLRSIRRIIFDPDKLDVSESG